MAESLSRIVDPHWFAEQVHDTDAVVLEVSRDPSDEGYRAGHLPGARHVHWKEFAWLPSRRQFSTPAVMSERLASLGIGTDTPLVVYGDVHQFGVYAAWVAELAGHRHVSVLDGAKDYWVAAGLPLTNELPDVAPALHHPGVADHSSRITRDELLGLLHSDGAVDLLDVRSAEEYTGERVSPPTTAFDHGATSYGHIPGARHFFFKRFLDDSGRFRDAVDIRADLESIGTDLSGPLVTYCRLGHRASMSRYVLTHVVGLAQVQAYDGSWTEWGSLVDVPVATGLEPGDPSAWSS